MRGDTDQVMSRVREIRLDIFGDRGLANLAQAMNIPAKTWENFENGVAMPALILLRFIELTGVEPHWLLTGDGNRYRVPCLNSSHGASQKEARQ
jgi:hypothetical protein